MTIRINDEMQEAKAEQSQSAENQEIWTIKYLYSRFSLMNNFVEDAIRDIAKTIALELHQQNIYIAVYQDVITKCHSLQEDCHDFKNWLDEDRLYRYFENRVVEELKSNSFFNVIYHHTHESRTQELDNTSALLEFGEAYKKHLKTR
jgi:hypothetical protein